MDNSETFIKQCEKAEEIQENWVHHIGDWLVATKEYIGTSNGGVIHVGDLCIAMNEFHDGGIELGVQARTNEAGYSFMRKADCIWLPRQDQLQAILEEEYAINLLYAFHDWYNTKADYPSADWSMEQLWLAFVMKEKYNKVWNGDKWIAG